MPFGIGVYEQTLIKSVVGMDTIQLATLNTIRTGFINNYFAEKYNEKYPVVLFNYQKKMIDLGLFEAYNYWLLMKGDEETFSKWYDQHQQEWKDFTGWFIENPLVIGEENKFHSSQF